MTSLDDSVITKQNIMLLDNVTNYDKIAIDYFHTPWQKIKDLQLSWLLLCKMKKHKLLRLPSCSVEDDVDYYIYLQRLHHCLWRRWAIENSRLNGIELDPLGINWNKETDITVLYGPDLSISNNNNKNNKISGNITLSSLPFNTDKGKDTIPDTEFFRSDDFLIYSSSVDSSSSLLFDTSKYPTTSTAPKQIPVTKSLRFSEIVKKRDITMYGEFKESHIQINDLIYFNKRLKKDKRSYYVGVSPCYPSYTADIYPSIIEMDDGNTLNKGNYFNDFMFGVM